MAPFHAKIGWKTQRKRENKMFHSIPFHFYPTRNRKFKNTIMASFQAKIDWKMPRK